MSPYENAWNRLARHYQRMIGIQYVLLTQCGVDKMAAILLMVFPYTYQWQCVHQGHKRQRVSIALNYDWVFIHSCWPQSLSQCGVIRPQWARSPEHYTTGSIKIYCHAPRLLTGLCGPNIKWFANNFDCVWWIPIRILTISCILCS